MRLIIVVEGGTEERFVKRVLTPHLQTHGVYAAATIVGKRLSQRRSGARRGGGNFGQWRRDIAHQLGTERGAGLRVTTLFDLYGLPRDFPGLTEHEAMADTNQRCDALQAALARVF